MTYPPPLTQRNHKGWHSAPDAILLGHRKHPSGSRQGHPLYTEATGNGEAVGGPTPTPQMAKSRCNDASPRQSNTHVFPTNMVGKRDTSPTRRSETSAHQGVRCVKSMSLAICFAARRALRTSGRLRGLSSCHVVSIVHCALSRGSIRSQLACHTRSKAIGLPILNKCLFCFFFKKNDAEHAHDSRGGEE